MMKARTIIMLLCVVVQHLSTGCVDASSNSMAAAEQQQQQGTLAGLHLGTQYTAKVITCYQTLRTMGCCSYVFSKYAVARPCH
jgi:hypothetical protein